MRDIDAIRRKPKMALVPMTEPEPERCGAVCPRNRYARCEYLTGHEGLSHFGRDRHGRWLSWKEAGDA